LTIAKDKKLKVIAALGECPLMFQYSNAQLSVTLLLYGQENATSLKIPLNRKLQGDTV
jgi:hypothetical protein